MGILRARLNEPSPVVDLVVIDRNERERAVARAESLLRAIGPHLDREAEVLAALFEDAGERCGPVLGPWSSDGAA